jgi:hypothetical protein
MQSLGYAGELLEKMNVQFQATQSGLEELVSHAKTSTVEQMALGRSQVEELTAVLRGLMTQMSESAGRSVSAWLRRRGRALRHQNLARPRGPRFVCDGRFVDNSISGFKSSPITACFRKADHGDYQHAVALEAALVSLDHVERSVEIVQRLVEHHGIIGFWRSVGVYVDASQDGLFAGLARRQANGLARDIEADILRVRAWPQPLDKSAFPTTDIQNRTSAFEVLEISDNETVMGELIGSFQSIQCAASVSAIPALSRPDHAYER